VRSHRDDDVLKRLSQPAEIPDRRLQSNVAAARAHEVHRGLGKKPRQIDARQQEVACFGCGAKRVAQHVDEHLRRRELGRRVERRDAQRPPQEVGDAPGLPVLRKQLRHGYIVRQAIAGEAQACGEAHRAETLAQRQAARAEKPAGEAAGATAQVKVAYIADLERQAQ